MSIQEKFSTLADNLRLASGYQYKLSLNDMGSMITGLTSYNLLPDTSSSLKTLNVDEGQWSVILFQDIKLSAGVYTFSIFADLTDSITMVSNRIEWTPSVGHNVVSSDSINYDWGCTANKWVTSGSKGLLSTTFKLAVDDTLKLGLSGNPFKASKIKYSSPMLSAGTFLMPYTSKTLVLGGGEINYLFLCCHFFVYLKGW